MFLNKKKLKNPVKNLRYVFPWENVDYDETPKMSYLDFSEDCNFPKSKMPIFKKVLFSSVILS